MYGLQSIDQLNHPKRSTGFGVAEATPDINS